MQKLSILTFSRNHIERTFSLIEDLYEIADDIVLMDSSDKEDREKLYAAKRKNKWNKLKIYYSVPLGFMELYRPFGLRKCRNDWVLYICADERISGELKSDIIGMINTTKCVAFNFNRYENTGDRSRSAFFTFQMMLIRKSKVKYKGVVDERPEVDGEVCIPDSSKYYVRHITKLMHHETNDYYATENKFKEYECMSYSDLNKRIIENIARARGKDPREMERNASGRAILLLMCLYERLRSKSPEREISPFDYAAYYLWRDIGYHVKSRRMISIPLAFTNFINAVKMRSRLISMPDHDVAFGISRIMNGKGPVRFLGLDKESVLRKLNRRYKDNKEGLAGISLYSHLLEEKYRQTHQN